MLIQHFVTNYSTAVGNCATRPGLEKDDRQNATEMLCIRRREREKGNRSRNLTSGKLFGFSLSLLCRNFMRLQLYKRKKLRIITRRDRLHSQTIAKLVATKHGRPSYFVVSFCFFYFTRAEFLFSLLDGPSGRPQFFFAHRFRSADCSCVQLLLTSFSHTLLFFKTVSDKKK